MIEWALRVPSFEGSPDGIMRAHYGEQMKKERRGHRVKRCRGGCNRCQASPPKVPCTSILAPTE